MTTVSELLNWQVAWTRVVHDLENRVFVRYPNEQRLVESDLPGWLAAVADSVSQGTYHPAPLTIAEVPKGGGLLRPGPHLSLKDHLVYTACVGACMSGIHDALSWSQGVVDLGYQLAANPTATKWIKSRFDGWTQFRTLSVKNLREAETSSVVFTDITAFYENINLQLLFSDLRSCGAPEAVVDLLSKCLNRWAQGERGIPQGVSASDILAKLYLNVVDLQLKAENYQHLRYVDDIRIFCADGIDAKKALITLLPLLRRRGLNVQSAKTKTLPALEAIEKLEAVVETVRQVAGELAEVIGDSDPYLSIAEIDQILSETPEDPPVAVLDSAYERFFSDHTRALFDASLFRFLLNRMARTHSRVPLDLGISKFLATQPQETDPICSFIVTVATPQEIEALLVGFIRSTDAVYPYQVYQVLQHLLASLTSVSEDTLGEIRRLSFDLRQPPYVRVVARTLLGQYGTAADLERLESRYQEGSSDLEKSELICSLRRMETQRRNSFLARVRRDGQLQDRAANLVRTGGLP